MLEKSVVSNFVVSSMALTNFTQIPNRQYFFYFTLGKSFIMHTTIEKYLIGFGDVIETLEYVVLHKSAVCEIRSINEFLFSW